MKKLIFILFVIFLGCEESQTVKISPLNKRVWENYEVGAHGYELFITRGLSVVNAVNTDFSGIAYVPGFGRGDMTLYRDRTYVVCVPSVIIRHGQAPQFALQTSSLQSNGEKVIPGDNIFELTLTGTPLFENDGTLQVYNNEAADWSCGEIEIWEIQ